MVKVLFKTIVFSLLLTVLASQIVSAGSKLYQYDGKMPFVEMMLNMMSVMGVIDKVPAHGAYGLPGYPGSRWSGYNDLYSRNPYLSALTTRGLPPGSTSNPLLRSPWLNSPWSQSALNTPSPVWGSPSWGVLPMDGYTPYGSQWSPSDLTGWVNEPWEASAWNPAAEPEATTQSSSPNVPLVQNFYNVPEKTRQSNQSPLMKLMPAERSQGPPGWRSNAKAKKPSPLRKKSKQKQGKQQPCVTDFCGLKKPNLNGLWVTQSGEMLGIKNKRYLWNDGDSRYLTGKIKIQNEYLLASVDEHEKLMRFKYKLAGDHLLTMQPDGVVREFVRMPANRYRNY